MKQQHETFILECIRHGNKLLAYKTAYPDTSGEALRTAATRLFKKPEIQQRINEIMQPIREKAIAELESGAVERTKQEICSLQQRREQLAKIILGKWQVKKHIRLKDSIVEVYDDPSANAVIRAIDMDSKLAANKYKEKSSAPAVPMITTPAVYTSPPVSQTNPPVPNKLVSTVMGEPEYEAIFQRDIAEFKAMFPELPDDYLTNPIYMPWKHNKEEEVDEPKENTPVINNPTEISTPTSIPANTTSKEPTIDLWPQYSKLETSFRHLSSEQLKQRETNFRNMSLKSQRSLLRPLLETIELHRKKVA